ncbi:MAG: O-antigen ligase family protein [Elusimicrobiota bacterium]|jgi:O-antigen ligase
MKPMKGANRRVTAPAASMPAALRLLAVLPPALVLVCAPALLVDAFSLPKAALLRFGALLLLALALRPGTALAERSLHDDAPLLAWLGVGLLFTFASMDSSLSFFGRYQMYIWGFWTLASLAAVHAAASRLDPERTPRVLFAGTCAAAGAAVLLAFPMSAGGRPHSTLGTTLNYGGFLSMALPLLLCASLTERRGALRALAAAAFALAAYQLLGTLSRGAWLGALAALALWAGLNRGLLRRGPGRPVLLALLLAAAAAAAALGAGAVRQRARVFLSPSEQSASTRLELWRMSARMALDAHGWGSGLDSFGLRSPRYESPEMRQRAANLFISTYAHNEVLQVLVTLGLPGLAAYLWLWGSWILAALRRLRAASEEERPVLSALLCAALALWVHSQFNFPSISTLALQWAFLGSLSAVPGRPAAASRPRLARSLLVLAALAAAFCASELAADGLIRSARSATLRRAYPLAVARAEAAVRLDPRGEGYAMALSDALRRRALSSADAAVKRADLARAIEVTRRDAERHPFFADSWHNHAMALMWSALDLRKPDAAEAVEAERVELKAAGLAPTIAQFWNAVGEIRHFRGDLAGAKKAWLEAVRVDPGHRKANAWLENYVEEDVFLAAPQDLEVRGLSPETETDLRAAGKPLLKIANLRERDLRLQVRRVFGWGSLARCPEGWPEAAESVPFTPEAEEFTLAQNGVRVLSFRLRAPRGRACFLVRVRCIDFEVPVDRTVQVLTDTAVQEKP